MLTSYAKQFAYLMLCGAGICATVWGLGLAFDLHATGWGVWVFALPGVAFLGAGLSAMKAEQHEPDALPPALIRLP